MVDTASGTGSSGACRFAHAVPIRWKPSIARWIRISVGYLWLAPCTTIFCVRGHFVRACAPWSSKTGKKGSFSALRPPPSAFLAPAVRYAYSACIALPRCAKKIGLKSCSGDAVALGAFRQRSKHPRSAARRAVYCVRIYVITLNSMFTGCSWSRALQWCVICGARASAL